MTALRPTVYALAGLLLAACGDNGDGNEDTLFTGLSGLVIIAVLVWLMLRAVKKRRG